MHIASNADSLKRGDMVHDLLYVLYVGLTPSIWNIFVKILITMV